MKIGIFLPNATFDLPGSPEVGGIETFSFTVGEALQKLGHEVVLFGGSPKEGCSHRATTLTLELHPYWETRSIPDMGTRFQRLVQRLHFAWSIRHAWKKQRCDLVLLAKPFDWPVTWWWKKSRPDLRVVMGFHGTDFFAGDRRFYHSVDAAFAVSPRVAALAEERVGVRPALIPNPVDVDFFSPDPATAQPASGPWRIVSSGRLVGWKGFASLIEAVARLRDRHGIAATLALAGEGPERPALEAQIERLQLGGAVKLHGLLDAPALRALLRLYELYALPSIGLEAFSISALEAACVGLPLLLSDQVGLAQFLDPADYTSYPAREVDALVARLVELHARRGTDDPAARHGRIRAKFSADRTARQILCLVEQAAPSRRLLYLYPEEWTAHRAREVHTLSTCVALARAGWNVTLLTAGGLPRLRDHLREISGGGGDVAGLELAALSRAIGPIRSASIFDLRFRRWMRGRPPFSQAFTIHLKAAAMLRGAKFPYLFEAHEIFAETPQRNQQLQLVLEDSERAALTGAHLRVATSRALADALVARYALPNEFAVVPNAGEPPLEASVAKADGPFVYCGSIADWKGLELVIEGARLAGVPLRIVGGTAAEWSALGQNRELGEVEWKPRVALADIPAALTGARAGLIPTRPETGSGRYSCPMKLFDYARCGLPVLSTGLPSLQSLEPGAWCTAVKESTAEAWAGALRAYRFNAQLADEAMLWAAGHTWQKRAEALTQVFSR